MAAMPRHAVITFCTFQARQAGRERATPKGAGQISWVTEAAFLFLSKFPAEWKLGHKELSRSQRPSSVRRRLLRQIRSFGGIGWAMGANLGGRMMRAGLAFCCCCMAMVSASAAQADLKLCNKTESRIGVAIGYRDDKGWTSEGWWNVKPNSCETLLKGKLSSRFYYIYAVDYDRGGEWAGAALMCTDNKAFTIRGIEDCQKRGFRPAGFFEIDTADEPEWTVRLTDPAQAGTATN